MESDLAATSPSESERLARGARFAIVAIVLAVSVPSLYAALSISAFITLYRDMLGSQPLPTLTHIVFSARPTFWFLGVVVPVGAIATLCMRQLVQSFYILGALVFVSTVQFIILYLALTAPLMTVLTAMTQARVP